MPGKLHDVCRVITTRHNPPMPSHFSGRALNDAMTHVATLHFGDPGWSDALVERHGFTATRSARGRIDVQDLMAYPKLRGYLQQRYGASPYDAVKWWRSVPDSDGATVAEKRGAIKAYRHYVLMDVIHMFLEDVVRRRE